MVKRWSIIIVAAAICVAAVIVLLIYRNSEKTETLSLPVLMENISEGVRCYDAVRCIEALLLDSAKEYIDRPSAQTLESAFAALDRARADAEALALPVNRFSAFDAAEFEKAGINATDYHWLFSSLPMEQANVIAKAEMFAVYLDMAAEGGETFQYFTGIVDGDLLVLEIETQVYYLSLNGMFVQTEADTAQESYMEIVGAMESFIRYELPWETDVTVIELKIELLIDKLEQLISEESQLIGQLELDVLNGSDALLAVTQEEFDLLTEVLRCHDTVFFIYDGVAIAIQAFAADFSPAALSAALAVLDEAETGARAIVLPASPPEEKDLMGVSWHIKNVERDRGELLNFIDFWRGVLETVSNGEGAAKADAIKRAAVLFAEKLPVQVQRHYLYINNCMLYIEGGDEFWHQSVETLDSYGRWGLPWESEEAVIEEKSGALFDEQLERVTELNALIAELM